MQAMGQWPGGRGAIENAAFEARQVAEGRDWAILSAQQEARAAATETVSEKALPRPCSVRFDQHFQAGAGIGVPHGV